MRKSEIISRVGIGLSLLSLVYLVDRVVVYKDIPAAVNHTTCKIVLGELKRTRERLVEISEQSVKTYEDGIDLGIESKIAQVDSLIGQYGEDIEILSNDPAYKRYNRQIFAGFTGLGLGLGVIGIGHKVKKKEDITK